MRFLLLTGLLLGACRSPVDLSIKAVEAGDLTLIHSACESVPGRGVDVCRVKEGQPIEASWILIIPEGRRILGGEIKVFWKDIVKSYAVAGSVVTIPWKDIIGQEVWDMEHRSQALALGEIRYKTNEGLEETVAVRGQAVILVLKDGYSPLPIDSGLAAFSTTCKVEYSTSGRSAIKCN